MASPAEEKQCCIIKRIKFFGRGVKIVMQNENGPCPLLAIANVLSLRNELKLPAGAREITQSELITSIVDLLLERSKHFEAAYAADYQQNISEIFPVLQKLTTGVDVNVKFHNLHAFEPTPEVAVFDLLGIPLVHGWLVDPQDRATAAVFSNKSYNELVEMLFLVLGDEEMEALSTGPLRNLSISSHHMQQHSFSSAAGSPLAAARTPSANATAPGSQSTSFRSGGAAAAAAAAAATAAQNAELHKALHALSIAEGSQQQRQQQEPPLSQQRESVGGAAAPPSSQEQEQQQQPAVAAAPTATSSLPQQQQQQQGSADTCADPDTVIEALMEDIMQEVCSTSMPGSIELGDSPTHNGLLTRRRAYEGRAATAAGTPPSRLGGAAAGSGQPHAQQQQEQHQPGPAAAGPAQQQQDAATPAAAAAAAAGGNGGPPKASAADAAVVRRFIEAHCSQLTPYGLTCMAEGLKEHQLAVFFRNNHFNALFKYEGAVYLLVTDQGYEYEPDIVWERLDSVQGDTTFCTSDFTPFVPHRAPLDSDAEAAAGGASYSHIVAGGAEAAAAGGDLAALTDLDAAIAASLAAEEEGQHRSAGGQQQQQHQQAQMLHGAQGGLSGAGSLAHEDADFALALQLQLQEEEAMASAQVQQQQQQGGLAGQGRGQQQQQQRQGSGGSRLAAVQQQEQQAAAQPLESLRQMGHRLAAGVQQQYAAATNALLDQQQQQPAQQQQQQGRRRSSGAAGGKRSSSAQDEKCSIM